MELMPGYKQTEVGVIPEDWSTARLSALVEKGSPITYGVVKPGSNDLDGVLFIRGGDIFAGRIEERRLRKIPKAVSEQYKRTLLEGGEILVSLVGYPGEAAIVPPHLRGANIARQVALVRLSTQLQIFPDYICKFLQSDLGKRQLLKEAIGSAQQVINLRDIQKVAAVIPSTTSEQRAIAEALSDADALIESLDKLIAKKRQIKQGAMQELLTGKRRLPGFEGEWVIKRLGDVAEISKGQLITESTAIPGDVPVIAGGKKPAYFHNRANRTGKTITISGSGASAGYVAFYESPIFASDCSTIGEGGNYSVEFIYFVLLLNQEVIYKAQTGGAQPHIHPDDLRPLMIHVPIDCSEQAAIATILSDMDTELAALESRLAKARQIKQGMMQELLTGRIRLL
jgi:type I restriction enzyme S subunit